MSSSLTLEWLQHEYPAIRWDEPVKMTTPRGEGWDCRVCIANNGKKPSQGPQFATWAAAKEHIGRDHA